MLVAKPYRRDIRRHRRFWIAPTLEGKDVRGCSDPVALEALLDWIRSGRPLVGRAALPHEVADDVPLGLASNREDRRVRVSFRVPERAVTRVEPPLTLAEVAPGLPPKMRHAAEPLVENAAELGVPLHVYGSAFWQHVSGLPYLRADSDLDLLARPETAADARRWLGVLARLDASSATRLDGEVETPAGDGVAWRELAGAGDTILVKCDTGALLRPRASVWAAWEKASSPC
jgi:phosphoribosyl-dephospho-CoA transferase